MKYGEPVYLYLCREERESSGTARVMELLAARYLGLQLLAQRQAESLTCLKSFAGVRCQTGTSG